MFKWIHHNLKWFIARREMEMLHRFDVACEDAMRWLASDSPDAAGTAQWIKQSATVGDVSIVRWRDAVRSRQLRRSKAACQTQA